MHKVEQVDAIYKAAIDILAQFVSENPAMGKCALETMLVVRKIERIGDHCNNIVEEIVFYIDAKILKHRASREN
jgi:phosphate transport system protein